MELCVPGFDQTNTAAVNGSTIDVMVGFGLHMPPKRFRKSTFAVDGHDGL